jgi:hypothetical protein
MAKLADLLTKAIDRTIELQNPAGAAYQAWLHDSNGPLSPTVPASDNLGSYPTADDAMAALAEIADTCLENEPDFQRTVTQAVAL